MQKTNKIFGIDSSMTSEEVLLQDICIKNVELLEARNEKNAMRKRIGELTSMLAAQNQVNREQKAKIEELRKTIEDK